MMWVRWRMIMHAAGFDLEKKTAAVKAGLSGTLQTFPKGLGPAEGGCGRDQASQESRATKRWATAVCMEGGCWCLVVK